MLSARAAAPAAHVRQGAPPTPLADLPLTHTHSLTYSLTPVRIPPFALAQLSETASSRWYLLIECLPHVFGSIALRFVLADVLGLEIFAMDVVSGFANSAIFVSE